MDRRLWRDLDDGKVETLIAALQATAAAHSKAGLTAALLTSV